MSDDDAIAREIRRREATVDALRIVGTWSAGDQLAALDRWADSTTIDTISGLIHLAHIFARMIAAGSDRTVHDLLDQLATQELSTIRVLRELDALPTTTERTDQ